MSFAIYKGIIAIAFCFSYVYGGQFCLSCSDAPDMVSCRQITQCKDEEVCFVHKYSNDRDQIRYDMGCSYPEICLKDEPGHLFGKRSDHNHILCQQCCNNTHICNADLPCNGHIQDEVCLSCSGVETPKACLRNTSCNKEEVCYMHKYQTESGKLLYDFGCKPASLCVHAYTNVFGRQISEGKHQICEDCCHGSHLCNRNITCNHFNQNSVNGSCSTTYECRSNLLCLTGTCKCQSDEYYWGDDRCMYRKAAYSLCEKSNECQESLSCIHLTCQCIDTEYWNGSSCIIKNNYQQSCQISTQCKKTLYCYHQHCTCDHNDYWTGHYCSERKSQGVYCNSTNQCKSTLFCKNSTCSCPNDYYWSSAECLPKKNVNGSCLTTNECHSNLICINRTCKCQSNDFYWGESRCMSRKVAHSHCEKFNECQESLQCINFTCRCIDTESWNGSSCIIRKTHQQSCQVSTECKKTLYCNHQHCTCDHNDYWTGHYCSERKSKGAYCNSMNQCKPTLFCENSMCSCPNNYYWSSSECLPKKSFNITCRNSFECFDKLVCQNYTCQCRKSFRWSGVECNKCVSECAYIDQAYPDGVYVIFPDCQKKSVLAYCFGPGRKWTVIQRRFNGSLNFDRTWKEYKEGFGSAYGELWLGNEYIHSISNDEDHEISFKIVTANGNIKYANFSLFKTNDELSGYNLTLNGYSGDAGNSYIDLLNHQSFWTRDHDNPSHCATSFHGGWWYEDCFNSNLNTPYRQTQFKWDNAYKNLRQSTMLIRKK